MKKHKHIVLVPVVCFAAACATPGTHPHDMGAVEHGAAASAEDNAATAHAAEYDPTKTATRERCAPTGARGNPSADAGACWSSVVNPTDEHRRAAEVHRKRAAEHRAASTALRDAETAACAGIEADDRDMSPFEHREDITQVSELFEGGGKGPRRLVGATVAFLAVPGMTPEWLQRVVDCHLARNAALGHVVPEMPDCPLVPNGVAARVRSTGNGFAVDIRSESAATAKEVFERASRLKASAQ